MKKFFSFCAFFSFFSASFLQALAPHGAGELIYRLKSPVFLGGGAHLTRVNSVQGVLLNPAAAAGLQRNTLDINYSNLQGFDSSVPGMGHAANIGFAIPTRFGVLTSSLGFLDTSAYAGSAMDLGLMGSFNFAFSKELYRDLWIGVGLDAELGQLSGNLDGGGALSFGFLHFSEKFSGIKNFRWGMTLSGLGYRYGTATRSYFDAILGNITPAIGFAFDPVVIQKFSWTFRTDLKAPSVTDLWLGIANDFSLGEALQISFSSSVDIRDALAGSWQTLIPAATLSINFSLDGKNKDNKEDDLESTEMNVLLAAAPLYDGVWAFSGGVSLPFGIRDNKAPTLDLDYEELPYISPNYDGIQDELILPYEVKDERYVVAYEWEIRDDLGNLTRRYQNKEERPENESVKNLWKRLFAPKQGTALPEAFRWDGVSDAGSLAPDGKYSLVLEFRDDNDNVLNAGPYPIMVDTLAPELSLSALEGVDLVFSPDGDGHKENLLLQQSGSVEHDWEAGIQDREGENWRQWTWTDRSPESLEWDGTSDGGTIVPDDVYRYLIAATDRAGNKSEDVIEGIVVDTRQPEVGLSINRAIFSPETMEAVSSLSLIPDVTVKAGVVDWTLEILDENERSVKTWTRREGPALPEVKEYLGRDDEGNILSEGRYRGRLSVAYSNGHQPLTYSPYFKVDLTAPQAKVSVDRPLFSPKSGGQGGRLKISQETSIEETWRAVLRNNDRQEVNSWLWVEQAVGEFLWDGRDNEGRLVPDGLYSYTLEATDLAGNRGISVPVAITVDTSAVEASLTTSLDAFSPTGNGVNEELLVFMNARTDSPIQNWSLQIVDDSDQEIRRWEGSNSPRSELVWDGKDSQNNVSPDGEYRALLSVTYLKGDIIEAGSGLFLLDTQAPRIELLLPDPLFSPDGDGEKDVLPISQSSSREDFFDATIYDEAGEVLRTWRWKDEVKDFSWDGKDNSGNALPDGNYRYELTGMDRAGNSSRKNVSNIRLDTAATPVYLRANEAYIKAGETDPDRQQRFTVLIPNNTGISSWSFTVESKDSKTIVKQEVGEGAVPQEFSWDGLDQQRKVAEGNFIGALDLHYAKGARPRAESRPFVSDASPPKVTITVNPQPFSPDNDNVDDEVVLALSIEDATRIREWNLLITDPRKREFITFSGQGRPSERIIWDGRSGNGELVQSAEDYPYLFTISDILGNKRTEEGFIPVDVLVIREGDRLKILINNITFQPSSARLTRAGKEGEKNAQVLDRLAEIMEKYARYRIVVEGHAASLKWEDPVAAAQEESGILVPLSRSRAQTVVDELSVRGVGENRLSVEGLGGKNPIVPHSNIEERWRNRRVEFYLEK